jgi:hypothetical protein
MTKTNLLAYVEPKPTPHEEEDFVNPIRQLYILGNLVQYELDHTYGSTNIIGSRMVNFGKLSWLKNGVHKGLYCDRKLMKYNESINLESNFEMYNRLSFIQWSNCR